MNILIACEFSGVVRDAFIARGHYAISCDIEPTERPGPHYQGDVRDILYDGWDMMIAFPPCTYLSYAGNRVWHSLGRAQKREAALHFVRLLLDAPIPKIALENPLGCISTAIRKPDQIIQPYHFGEIYSKRTCLWFKGLPPLMTTCIEYNPRMNEFVLCARHDKNRARTRSRTFPGVALAMAAQWG